MRRGLQLASCIKFRSSRTGQTSYSTVVLGSVAAQEQTNSIAEGSAAGQQRPQGPHQPQNFVELSGERRNKELQESVVRAMAMPWLHYWDTTCYVFWLEGRQE